MREKGRPDTADGTDCLRKREPVKDPITGSDPGRDHDELRRQADDEPDQDPPERDLPRQLAPHREQLAYDVEDGAGGQREESDEDVRARDRVPNERSQERRTAPDEP